MKIKFLIICLLFASFSTFGQRKKVAKKSNTATILAKYENVSAELFKNNFYLLNLNAINNVKTDTILLKNYTKITSPSECKISLLNFKANRFFLVSWTEKEKTTTKLITEDATTIFTEICDFTTKTKILSNFQKTTLIKEIRFLDANQTVSETIDKVRKEGNELKLLTDGEISLNNKNGEAKWVFSPKDKMYIVKKK